MKTANRFERYFDSGLLVKLYHLETGTEAVAARVYAAGCIPLSFLAEMEVRNALRVLRGRNVFSEAVLQRALEAMEEDLGAGRLQRMEMETGEWRKLAESLSRRYAGETLCRTLDLWHVAMASAAKIPILVTGDRRQARLGKRAGLQVDWVGEMGPA